LQFKKHRYIMILCSIHRSVVENRCQSQAKRST